MRKVYLSAPSSEKCNYVGGTRQFRNKGKSQKRALIVCGNLVWIGGSVKKSRAVSVEFETLWPRLILGLHSANFAVVHSSKGRKRFERTTLLLDSHQRPRLDQQPLVVI